MNLIVELELSRFDDVICLHVSGPKISEILVINRFTIAKCLEVSNG